MATTDIDTPTTEVLHPPRSAAEELEELWALTHDERVAAMYAGELTQRQCFAWARRAPADVPLLEGEFWFIAITTPEVCEASER
jgi:hypothetical protein